MFDDEKNGQNNSYGSYNYGSSYGQQGNSSNGYVNNNYMNNQNPYGTQGSYSNQNSYGYGNGQQTYGTYQYSSNNFGSAPDSPKPPKKKNTAAIVIAAILALSLVVGGVGAGYYAYSRHGAFITQKDSQAAQIEDKGTVAEAETENTEESDNTEVEKKVETTTTSAATSVVVTDVTQVVSEVMPAMVIIHNNYTASANYFGYTQTQEATASGSGIIVGENDTELLIATNYHVVEGADSLEVIFNDETSVEAVVKGTDSDMDLAVIAVLKEDMTSDTFDSIKVATLGDSDALTLGEPAIAIGNALGYGQSVTTGVISAVNREVEISDGVTHTFIQTDAAINPGNSGGALLNIQGEVIGINSNKIGGDTVEGMGYAIPISVAKPIIDKLMNEETKRKVSDEERGYIGISGVSVTSSVSQMYGLPMGVYVAEVGENGGAAEAGIRKGDVIVEFDGEEITSMDDLQNRLEYYAKGTTVSVTVMRQNGSEYEEITMDVTLGESSAASSSTDSNAGESNGKGQYDGQQQPGLPDDKNGQNGGNAQQEGGGH